MAQFKRNAGSGNEIIQRSILDAIYSESGLGLVLELSLGLVLWLVTLSGLPP